MWVEIINDIVAGAFVIRQSKNDSGAIWGRKFGRLAGILQTPFT